MCSPLAKEVTVLQYGCVKRCSDLRTHQARQNVPTSVLLVAKPPPPSHTQRQKDARAGSWEASQSA
jgi:hypothetical protein